MSILNPQFCRSIHRWRRLSRMAAVALPVTVLAACSDQILPTVPPAPQDALSAGRGPGETPPNFAAGTVTCDVAVRSADGRYTTRKISMEVPRNMFDPNGRTIKFAYRGVKSGSSEPTWFALCLIPATLEARAHFERLFSVARTPGARTNLAADSTATPLQLAPRVTDPAAVTFEGELAACEPYAIMAEPGCGGGDDGGGEWEGPPPPDGDSPDADDAGSGEGGYSLYSDDGVYAIAPPVISCNGRTDYPHASSHVFGMANVLGQTLCNVPISQSITVTLSKQSCFWIFCWWSGRGYGFDGGVKTLVRANAAAPCSSGYWRGQSNHSMYFGFGYWPPWSNRTTWATNYLWC